MFGLVFMNAKKTSEIVCNNIIQLYSRRREIIRSLSSLTLVSGSPTINGIMNYSTSVLLLLLMLLLFTF